LAIIQAASQLRMVAAECAAVDFLAGAGSVLEAMALGSRTLRPARPSPSAAAAPPRRSPVGPARRGNGMVDQLKLRTIATPLCPENG
jgi:hypothetical protein